MFLKQIGKFLTNIHFFGSSEPLGIVPGASPESGLFVHHSINSTHHLHMHLGNLKFSHSGLRTSNCTCNYGCKINKKTVFAHSRIYPDVVSEHPRLVAESFAHSSSFISDEPDIRTPDKHAGYFKLAFGISGNWSIFDNSLTVVPFSGFRALHAQHGTTVNRTLSVVPS